MRKIKTSTRERFKSNNLVKKEHEFIELIISQIINLNTDGEYLLQRGIEEYENLKTRTSPEIFEKINLWHIKQFLKDLESKNT